MSQGFDMDAHASRYQTRDMLRDAPIRLGFFAGVVSSSILCIVLRFHDVGPATPSGWLLVGLGTFLLAGGGVGYIALKRAQRADARRVARETAERAARKDQELADFLATKAKESNETKGSGS